ncbi:hypothetical protein MM440_08695 [Arsenicicoccus piscis]|nr:hypothetical protein [Arsenicicoccus piscis]MCH8627861.1 hypothetical protein [Arsenicicoccus piscis]
MMKDTYRRLTRDEALAWRDWSLGDRRVIEENFDRLGATTFGEVPSGAYVHAVDADDRTVMYLNPGYIEFPGGAAPEGALFDEDDPLGYVVLSTFKSRRTASAVAVENLAQCPIHPGLTLPASGRCDECG